MMVSRRLDVDSSSERVVGLRTRSSFRSRGPIQESLQRHSLTVSTSPLLSKLMGKESLGAANWQEPGSPAEFPKQLSDEQARRQGNG